jgi:hypothetical protein
VNGVATISDYSFGRITVDGVEHKRDLIVLPGRVVSDWWRLDGHSLALEDLADVEAELPERLILGCGAQACLRPPAGVIEELRSRGIAVESMPTAEAVRRYGEADPLTTAAALHLTC